MRNVPPPAAGLGSNSNYLLFDSCNILSGVAVTIDLQSDIIASAGFGMQLNTYPPTGETCIFQQYCIVVDTSGQITCIANNWARGGAIIINNWVPLYRLPGAALPAGYQCRVALESDPTGVIISATFSISAIAPASGSALSSFVDAFGEHVYFISMSGHLHQLISTQPNWLVQDLTGWAHGPQVANGSALTSFVDGFGEHVCYTGTDGHVHKLMTAAGGWQDNDLTAWAHGPQAADGSALTSFVDAFGEHVCYICTDGHVHKLMTAAGGWQDNDLTAWAHGPQAANGSALTSFVDAFGEHVCYIGTDGHVHKLMTGDNVWLVQDLTGWAHGPQAANGSALTSFVDAFGEHVCYIGTDGHVHKLMTGDNVWLVQDSTGWAHGPQVANGSALTSFVDAFGEHVCYTGTDGHVHKLMTAAGEWQDNDLTAWAHGPQVANGTALTSFVDGFGEHVCYIGTDGHVHKLMTAAGGWQDGNLESVTVVQTLAGLPSTDLSPIVAIELDIVGYDNGQSTILSSGSGTITYSAANAMTVVNVEPQCCPAVGTAETANTAYGDLPTGPSTNFVQTFTTSSTTIRAPKSEAFRKRRPGPS